MQSPFLYLDANGGVEWDDEDVIARLKPEIVPEQAQMEMTLLSEQLAQPVEFSGQFAGRLGFSANKKDLDLNILLYELLPNGDYLQLFDPQYELRASFAKDRSHRQLLTAGAPVSTAGIDPYVEPLTALDDVSVLVGTAARRARSPAQTPTTKSASTADGTRPPKRRR